MVKKGDYVIVDIETTGLSKRRHKITEIAAVKIKNKEIIEEFSTLVNPRCRIPAFITRLTGINNKMIKNAPFIEKVLPKFLKFLGSSVFVAHCATFDYNFLNHNCELHLNKSIGNPKLCTRKLANRLLHDLPSKRLSNLCEYFDIINEQAHRARPDAIATTHILNNFLDMLKKKRITSYNKILRFQDSKIKRDI